MFDGQDKLVVYEPMTEVRGMSRLYKEYGKGTLPYHVQPCDCGSDVQAMGAYEYPISYAIPIDQGNQLVFKVLTKQFSNGSASLI